MSYINLLRRELSRPADNEFPQLLRLNITRQRNPHAGFQCFRLEEDPENFEPGPFCNMEIPTAAPLDILKVHRLVNSIRSQLAWALDIKLTQLLKAGRDYMPDFGSPAYVEIHTLRSLTDFPERNSFYYDFKTFLRLSYVVPFPS